MGDNSLYGSTKELMAASASTDTLEKGGKGAVVAAGGAAGGQGRNGRGCGRPGMLNRQRSCTSFDVSAKKIDQVGEFNRSFKQTTCTFVQHLKYKNSATLSALISGNQRQLRKVLTPGCPKLRRDIKAKSSHTSRSAVSSR